MGLIAITVGDGIREGETDREEDEDRETDREEDIERQTYRKK